jgi:hypothetical protein
MGEWQAALLGSALEFGEAPNVDSKLDFVSMHL